ncbi:MAG: DUF5011 domain-containing protein [Mariprofundaceae bacterium]
MGTLFATPVFAGAPQTLSGTIRNADSSIPADNAITFNLYISSRPGEVLTQASAPGSGYIGGSWFSNSANFPTSWLIGDQLRIDVTNTTSGATGNSAVTLGSGGSVVMNVSLAVVVDTTAPTLSILGLNPTVVLQNSTFFDVGTLAADNVDGNISNNVVVTGVVDTATLGIYTLTYNVSDAAGNPATPVTRTVNVVTAQQFGQSDLVPPMLTLLGSNPTSVVAGNAYVEMGATATDDVDGNVSANVVITGSVNTQVIGTYNLVYTVSDAAGNAISLPRVVLVTAAAAGVDTTSPVITVLGANPLTVTLDSVYQEPGAIAADDQDGDITANIAISGVVDTSILGLYSVSYSVSDTSGNPATPVVRTVQVVDAATPATGDLNAPTLRLLGANPLLLALNAVYVELGATATDDVDANISSRIVITSAVNSALSGSYIVRYSVADLAGNIAIVNRSVVVRASAGGVDTFAPVVVAPEAIQLVADDYQGLSASSGGLATYLQSASAVDDVDGDLTLIQHDAPLTLPIGQNTITFFAEDAAGNIGSATSTVWVVGASHVHGILVDSDLDGLDDDWELRFFLGLDVAGASSDSDQDQLLDIQEMQLGLHPMQVDSDQDGIDDRTEVGDPLFPADTDADSLIDALEPGSAAFDASIAAGLLLFANNTLAIDAGNQLISQVSITPADNAPVGINRDFGMIGFVTTSPTIAGSSVPLKLISSTAFSVSTILYKVDALGNYTEISAADWLLLNPFTIELRLLDGGMDDLDNTVNGLIRGHIAFSDAGLLTEGSATPTPTPTADNAREDTITGISGCLVASNNMMTIGLLLLILCSLLLTSRRFKV